MQPYLPASIGPAGRADTRLLLDEAGSSSSSSCGSPVTVAAPSPLRRAAIGAFALVACVAGLAVTTLSAQGGSAARSGSHWSTRLTGLWYSDGDAKGFTGSNSSGFSGSDSSGFSGSDSSGFSGSDSSGFSGSDSSGLSGSDAGGFSGSGAGGFSGSGAGTGGLLAMENMALGHLWKVERMLVDTQLCPASEPEVMALRKQPWPRPDAGVPPTIGKILYINLGWDKGRKDYMEEQLAKLSDAEWEANKKRLDWERFDAIDKDSLQHGDQYATWRVKGFNPSKWPKVMGDWSTAACAYSHYAAMSTIPESPGSDLVIIAEDDVEFVPDFLERWKELWPYVPKDWDVLRVGWFSDHQNCSQAVNTMIDRAGWQDPGSGKCAYCGAQAYVVNPESKERVLKRFEVARMTHADELLGAPPPPEEDPVLLPPLKAYVVWPMLAKIHAASGKPVFYSDRMDRQKAMAEQLESSNWQ